MNLLERDASFHLLESSCGHSLQLKFAFARNSIAVGCLRLTQHLVKALQQPLQLLQQPLYKSLQQPLSL